MDRKTAVEIIAAYDALIDRAVDAVAPNGGFYASVQREDKPRLSIVGAEAVLEWGEYESDYYGGGYTASAEARFPADLLFLSDADFAAFQKKVATEIKEREQKVLAAQVAVDLQRKEAFDRAEFARLSAKYGKEQP